MEKKVLRKGYTTGVHTLHAFKSALEAYLSTQKTAVCKTLKIHNDDLDVTKGCEIIVTISSKKQNLTLNAHKQQAQIFKHKSNVLELFAGTGVGVVTKKGLKIPPSFPAINPKPLEALEHCFQMQMQPFENQHLFATVEVTHGEEIAKQTANAKVGVLGGISILGTSGIVKPVSSSAYIDSVRTEIQFAHNNHYKKIFFTLGNSAYKAALEQVNEESVIEIGNFVYDSIEIATELKIKQIVFLCGIGKMTKVYQGFKNTHNRFGTIDFVQLQQDIKEELHYEVDIESTLTVKGISQELETVGKLQSFYKMITLKANEQIRKWFPDSKVDAIILEQKEKSPINL